MKITALVVYEDGKPELERTARGISERLDSGSHEVKLRAASTVTIPEILAARLIILGAETPQHQSYAEIARVLSGINLAGRRAALFGPSGSAVAWLREIVADAELKIAGTDLIASRPEPAAIVAWLRPLL
jgi:hypothetical protein